jgi:hypothetical protein
VAKAGRTKRSKWAMQGSVTLFLLPEAERGSVIDLPPLHALFACWEEKKKTKKKRKVSLKERRKDGD